MGFTRNYGDRPRPVPRKVWNALVADVNRIFLIRDRVICRGPYDSHQAVTNENEIQFCNRGEDPGHIMWVCRTNRFSKTSFYDAGFVKTERLPYDEVVSAVMILMQHHMGEKICLVADGDNDHEQAAENWMAGLLLIATALGIDRAHCILGAEGLSKLKLHVGVIYG